MKSEALQTSLFEEVGRSGWAIFFVGESSMRNPHLWIEIICTNSSSILSKSSDSSTYVFTRNAPLRVQTRLFIPQNAIKTNPWRVSKRVLFGVLKYASVLRLAYRVLALGCNMLERLECARLLCSFYLSRRLQPACRCCTSTGTARRSAQLALGSWGPMSWFIGQMVVDLNSFHLESAFSREKKYFREPHV